MRELAQPEAGRTDVRMNDGACDPQGRFWAGTMAYDESPGAGTLYRLELDGSCTTVLTGLTIANGIGWSPDGSTMYLNDSGTGCLEVFRFEMSTGAITNRRTLVRSDQPGVVPDGLTVDEEGGIWVALWGGGAVNRYAPDGSLLASLELPVERPTSCAFGGPDRATLFITTAREGLDDDAGLGNLTADECSRSPASVYAGSRASPTADESRRPRPLSENRPAGAMKHTSVDIYLVIDTFLLLLIGIGPKIALVPFVEITAPLDGATKALIVRKMLTTATVVALILVGLGEFLSRLLHFSTGSLSIAGGIILFIIAITMVLGTAEPDGNEAITGRDPMRIAVFPLAIPYLLEPSRYRRPRDPLSRGGLSWPSSRWSSASSPWCSPSTWPYSGWPTGPATIWTKAACSSPRRSSASCWRRSPSNWYSTASTASASST